MAVYAPLLIPLLTALLSAMLRNDRQLQQWVSVTGGALLLAAAILLASRVAEGGSMTVALGGWPAPFAIGFTADGLSTLMVLVTAVLGFAVTVFLIGSNEDSSLPPLLHPLVHGLLAAACGALLTADLFNLYVWFELMLISVLGLLALGGQARHLEAAFKYFALNMLGTLLFLTAVALLYGATGQLGFAGLAEAARNEALQTALPPYIALLFAGFLLKAAVFPLYFWLPATYHTLPLPALALVGGLVTKIGIYVLLRLSGEVFVDASMGLREALGWIAIATMVSGVLGAAYHWDLRRILSFHIVSQIGYLLLGIALATSAGGSATLFFMAHNILAKASLFLIAGIMWRSAGHFDLRRIGGLYPARPLLALMFLVAGFSLVGVPPTSGFWGKFLLVQESFGQERYLWGGIALAVGLLTLYSITKIWLQGFWKPHPSQDAPKPFDRREGPAYAAAWCLVMLLLFMGLYPEPLIRFTESATAMLWAGGPS